MPPPVPAPGQAGSWLPRGASLRQEDWQWRHVAVCAVLALHVPFLVAWALLSGQVGEVWHLLLPVLPLLAAALLPALGRTARTLAAALGLLTCSALVVHLAQGATEAHFHFFVMVAVIALYQDWAVYLLAIAFVFVHHATVVVQDDTGLTQTWGWAATHAAFVVAESLVLVVFWRANELSREAEERAREALQRGQDSVQERIEDTERMRYDLIGMVSHEFRTPLTGIRGAALTLLKRGDRLDSESRERLLRAVLEQQERLSRLLENMLLAAQATEVDPAACSDVEEVATTVADAAAERGAPSVSVVVESGLTAYIDRKALEQVLANLVDNAVHHGAPGSTPLVAGGHDDAGVWVTVSNEGRVLDLTRKRELFEPFTQVDTGITRQREGIGVGLYVVRRLVEVYGGSIDVDSHSGWVTVEVRLRPGGASRSAAAASTPVTPLPVG